MRFHLDLTDGDTVLPDHVGVDAASLDDILGQARAVIAEMRARGDLDDAGSGWHMIVRDREGTVYRHIEVASLAS